MCPSEATNQATRDEWRELGFYYVTQEEPPGWLLVGSVTGLSKLVSLLDDYVQDSRNATLSEHEHYGPYMYLKVQTSEAPQIDRQGIRGSQADIRRLRELIEAGLRVHGPGESFVIGSDYSQSVEFPLIFQVREAALDPAACDPELRGSAV